MQLPASIMVERMGTRKCTILANAFNVIFILFILNCHNLVSLILAQFVSSLCFSLKDISDSALLRYSIPETMNKGKIFSKIEGDGYKNYYYLNAISAVLSGYFYVINPYIPMTISLICAILATIISLGFSEIEDKREKSKKKPIDEIKDYSNNLKKGMKFILKSQRLRSLFLYAGITWGVFCLLSTYRSSLLVDIDTPEQMITIIAALTSIASGIGSNKQTEFHNKYRNKSLVIILIMITIFILIGGIVGRSQLSYFVILVIVSLCFIMINLCKGMSSVLVTRYLGNFSNPEILTKILAVKAISRNIFRAAIGFLGSYLLNITNTANAMILIGIFLVVVTISLFSYMKTRLGLKPEEYDKNEIYKL